MNFVPQRLSSSSLGHDSTVTRLNSGSENLALILTIGRSELLTDIHVGFPLHCDYLETKYSRYLRTLVTASDKPPFELLVLETPKYIHLSYGYSMVFAICDLFRCVCDGWKTVYF